MISKIAEYKVKAECITEVLHAIRVFVQTVHFQEPNTFYEAYRKGASLEFVHIMKFPNHTDENTHAHAPYTNEFVKVLYPNCEKQPIFTDLTIVA